MLEARNIPNECRQICNHVIHKQGENIFGQSIPERRTTKLLQCDQISRDYT